MEEQQEKLEKKPKNFEAVNEEKKDKFIVKYIIFVFILILFTIGAVCITTNRKSVNSIKDKIAVVFEEQKGKAEDSKYLINSYSETYNENPIEIVNYYDNNGTLYTGEYHEYTVNYIQIDGLKDEKIQKELNKKLKETAYSMADKNGQVQMQVVGNFSNILSILVQYNNRQWIGTDGYKNKSINIDLTTGEDIPLQNIFISSTPIKSLLIDGLYEELYWYIANSSINENDWDNWEKWEEAHDMNNADTSEFEDKALLLAKKYEKQKDNLVFTITPTRVEIYNIIGKDLIDDDYLHYLKINLFKYKDETAIYKRYLTEKNIYKDNSLGQKNIIVFTDPYYENTFESLNYGKIRDNIFLEEAFYCYEDKYKETAKKFIENKSLELQNSIINETKQNEALICQRTYDISGFLNNEECFVISVSTYKAKCSKEYFKENAFKDYIKMKASPRADVGVNCFSEYLQDDFPNLKIQAGEYETYFLDSNGNLIATSWEEMEKLTKQKKEEELLKLQENQEQNNTIVTEIQEATGIIEETADENNIHQETEVNIINENIVENNIKENTTN